MAFANDEAFRQRIADVLERLVGVIEQNVVAQNATRRAASWQMVLLLGGMAAVLVGAVSYLTLLGKMSPDATAFLFGTIVGAAFTFARDVLVPPKQ